MVPVHHHVRWPDGLRLLDDPCFHLVQGLLPSGDLLRVELATLEVGEEELSRSSRVAVGAREDHLHAQEGKVL